MTKHYCAIALAASLLFASCGSNDEALRPIGLESAKVGGELQERLQGNYDRLETETYQPEQVYWSEIASKGWAGDKEGRTILALVYDAKATGREPKYLQTIMDLLPSKLNEKGYLGTIHPNINEQQLSGHGWLLRGLCEYYEWTGSEDALKIARGVVDNLFLPISGKVQDYPIRKEDRIANVGEEAGRSLNLVNGWRLSSDIGCVFIGMEGLIHYYKHDRDPKIKALIDELIELFLRVDLVGIKAQTHASLTALRGLLRYGEITGDDSLLPEIESRWKLYERFGMTEDFENFNWFERYDTWSEPCAIIDSYLVCVQLWAKTLDPYYLEMAEKIYYNGIASTQRGNGGFGCNIPVGPAFSSVSVRTYEASWCCTMRGGEGLGKAAEYAYFRKGSDFFVPFYRSNTLDTKDLALEQKTGYPFSQSVEFVVSRAESKAKLHLFIPSYMIEPKLSLNGKPLELKIEGGFALVDKKLKAGDTLRLDFRFEDYTLPATTVKGAEKTMRGPLVLGLDPETMTMQPVYELLNPAQTKESGWSRQVVRVSEKIQ